MTQSSWRNDTPNEARSFFSPVPNNYFWKRMIKEDKENHHQASPLISGDSQEISDQALMIALEKQVVITDLFEGVSPNF